MKRSNCFFPEWLIQSSIQSIDSATAYNFLRTTDVFFVAISDNRKHSGNDTVKTKRQTKSQKKSKETKERERARHLHEGDSRRNQATGIARQKHRILWRSRIKEQMANWEAARLFWTFQAKVGERRCRSCMRSQVKRANLRKRLLPKSDFVIFVSTNCGRYHLLLRSGSGASVRGRKR